MYRYELRRKLLHKCHQAMPDSDCGTLEQDEVVSCEICGTPFVLCEKRGWTKLSLNKYVEMALSKILYQRGLTAQSQYVTRAWKAENLIRFRYKSGCLTMVIEGSEPWIIGSSFVGFLPIRISTRRGEVVTIRSLADKKSTIIWEGEIGKTSIPTEVLLNECASGCYTHEQVLSLPPN